MYVKAILKINHVGFLKMEEGECRQVDDAVGKHLIMIGVAEENTPSHKKMKFKKKKWTNL